MDRETSKLGRCIRRYQYYIQQTINKNSKKTDMDIIIKDHRLINNFTVANCICKRMK